MDIYIIESRPVRKLTPVGYYRNIRQAYVAELERKNRCRFGYMDHQCDSTAREMYAQMTGKSSRVTDLVTTQAEADQLFEYFKIYANVWAYQVSGGADRKTSEKDRQIKRIADVLRSANSEQLKDVDIIVRNYIQSTD